MLVLTRWYWHLYLLCPNLRSRAIRIAVTQHNVVFEARLMGGARDAIMEDRFPAYVRDFFDRYFRAADKNNKTTITYPRWCIDALCSVSIDLLESADSNEDGIERLVVDRNGTKWEYSDLTNTAPRNPKKSG